MKARLLASILVLSSIQISCSNSSQNSLLGDYSATSTCPTGGCVTTTADANAAYLTASSAQFSLGTNDRRVDIGGECFDGNASSNKITVSYDNSKNACSKSGKACSPALPGSEVPITTSSTDLNTLICKNGRFEFSVPSSIVDTNSTPGVPVYLRVTLQPYDKSGQALVAGYRASISIAILRTAN